MVLDFTRWEEFRFDSVLWDVDGAMACYPSRSLPHYPGLKEWLDAGNDFLPQVVSLSRQRGLEGRVQVHAAARPARTGLEVVAPGGGRHRRVQLPVLGRGRRRCGRIAEEAGEPLPPAGLGHETAPSCPRRGIRGSLPGRGRRMRCSGARAGRRGSSATRRTGSRSPTRSRMPMRWHRCRRGSGSTVRERRTSSCTSGNRRRVW